MSENTYESTLLNNVAAVNLEVRIWSGRKKLRPEDLQAAAAGSIPPDKLASLGSKKTIDPEALRPFQRLRKEAERELSKIGVRFLGGWAVPLDKVDETVQKLDDIKTRFQKEKNELMANYGSRVDDWCDQFPEWAPIIRAAVEPPGTVERGMNFSFQVFTVAPPAAASSVAATGLEEEAEGLDDELLQSIAREAREWWEGSLEGAERVSQRGLRKLEVIRSKLEAWSFVHTWGWPDQITRQIERIQADLPKTGPVMPPQVQHLQVLALLLSEPERARRHAERMEANGGGALSGDELSGRNASAEEDAGDFAMLLDDSVTTGSETTSVPPVEVVGSEEDTTEEEDEEEWFY